MKTFIVLFVLLMFVIAVQGVYHNGYSFGLLSGYVLGVLLCAAIEIGHAHRRP